MDGLAATATSFRRRAGFMGLMLVTLTCMVYLMTLLRPVLEPLLWALFLVMALQPLTTTFEYCLLCAGQYLCGCGGSGTPQRKGRRPASLCYRRGSTTWSDDEDASATQGEDDDEGDMWRVSDTDVETLCSSCCACLSRIASVLVALLVVLGVGFLFVMVILDGVVRIKDNFAVYETGAKQVVQDVKVKLARVSGRMPSKAVDEISDNALTVAKGLLSTMFGDLLGHAGKFIVEFLMLGLYAMFWLCTPMPLNTSTEKIFRRYLFLKGSACLCYGICVGLLLEFLNVDLSIVFGLLSFGFSFIPEIGAIIATLLPIPIILFDSRLASPFLTLLTATAGQVLLKFVFANIIEVKLVEHDSTMKMHPVITLLAVSVFGFVWGPTGMLLCVPLMAYFKLLLQSDIVPAAYRDPVLVLLEGDLSAPERYKARSSRA